MRSAATILDDVGIERLENLNRTLHQPSKRGAVVRSANPTQTIQTRTAPAWDPEEGVYKFWVIGTDDGYRISADGLHWTPGPRPNIEGPMAVRDASDPDPSRRYKAGAPQRRFRGLTGRRELDKARCAPCAKFR